MKSLFTILHLSGVVIGMGAAFMTDVMFRRAFKNNTLVGTGLSYVKLGSKVVWIGLLVIILSGLLLFSLDPERYLNSSKFLAKMTIVAILLANGLVFHFYHLRNIRKNRVSLYVTGAISSVSWLSALILGSLRSVPFTYIQIMSVYGIVLMIAIVAALFSRIIFFRK